MSPFAAGCAICGTDLDTARWDTGPGVMNRIGSWFGALSFGPSRSLNPLLVLFIYFFGFGIISSLIAFVYFAL